MITAFDAPCPVIVVLRSAVERCATSKLRLRSLTSGARPSHSKCSAVRVPRRAGLVNVPRRSLLRYSCLRESENARAQCDTRALSIPLGTSLRSILFSRCNVQRASVISLRSWREALASDARALIESSAACRRILRSERSTSRMAAL